MTPTTTMTMTTMAMTMTSISVLARKEVIVENMVVRKEGDMVLMVARNQVTSSSKKTMMTTMMTIVIHPAWVNKVATVMDTVERKVTTMEVKIFMAVRRLAILPLLS